MSTIIIIGAGPHPNARTVTVTVTEDDGTSNTSYEVRDGDEVLGKCPRMSFARALLPLIQSGQ